jgi:hypothetical protein
MVPSKWLDVLRAAVELQTHGVTFNDSRSQIDDPVSVSFTLSQSLSLIDNIDVDNLIENILFVQRWQRTTTPNQVNMVAKLFEINDRSNNLDLIPEPNGTDTEPSVWYETLEYLPNIKDVIEHLNRTQIRHLKQIAQEHNLVRVMETLDSIANGPYF